MHTSHTPEQTLLAHRLESLLRLDPRLREVSRVAGALTPRSRPPGFPGLARIICGQQLSVASAQAIWQRLEAAGVGDSPPAFLALSEENARSMGLSRSKYATITGIARAILNAELDLESVTAMEADAAIAALTAYKGIGPWTAEIYLMFCAAHPDIFPVGDLALRKAVEQAFGFEAPVSRAELTRLAEQWSPHRSTAALLFWRFYATWRERESLPL